MSTGGDFFVELLATRLWVGLVFGLLPESQGGGGMKESEEVGVTGHVLGGAEGGGTSEKSGVLLVGVPGDDLILACERERVGCALTSLFLRTVVTFCLEGLLGVEGVVGLVEVFESSRERERGGGGTKLSLVRVVADVVL